MPSISFLVLTILFVIMDSANNLGIRHDIIKWSASQKDQFLQALYKMKSIPSMYDPQYSSYDYYTFVHIQQGIQKSNGLYFLPWNRALLYQFEQELQTILNDETFRLSFCDLTNKLSTFECFYDESFLGGNGIGIDNNSSLSNEKLSNSSNLSCSKWKIDLRLTATTPYKNDSCLSRNIGGNEAFDQLPDQHWWTDILDQDYNIYTHNWRQMTNAIHQYIGGHQATIAAPVDPIFWFIRAWVDAIWTMYQDEHGIYHNFPIDNEIGNKSLFDDIYFNQSTLTYKDVINTQLLHYSYSLRSSEFKLDPFPADKEWWESDFLWAFIFALISFMLCALIGAALIKCHRKRRGRGLSEDSLSLIWMERYPFSTISNAEKYTL